MGVMTAGLRERRKQETRQNISDVATVMFVGHGFDEVTIADVAAAAGVAKMTVTNYFPRKEDLVFDRADGIIASLAGAIGARAPGESMLTAIRRDYAERIAHQDVTLGLSSPQFATMIIGSPILASRGREIADQRERALAEAIAAETGRDDVQQRVVAAQLASVHRVLTEEATRRSLAGESRDQICAELGAEATRAFDRLEPALGNVLGPGLTPPGRAGVRPPSTRSPRFAISIPQFSATPLLRRVAAPWTATPGPATRVPFHARSAQRRADPLAHLLHSPLVPVRVGEEHELPAVAGVELLNLRDLDAAAGQLGPGRVDVGRRPAGDAPPPRWQRPR